MGFASGMMKLRDSPHHLRTIVTFILISFWAIFATTILLSTVLARYVTNQMMLRDAIVSAEFLNSVVHVEQIADFFLHGSSTDVSPDFEEFLTHVGQLPDTFRANVYSAGRVILWSSDPEMIGKSFPENEELDEALEGVLDPELVVVDRGQKEEHVGLPDNATAFIEYYIPIRSEDGNSIVGAVEVYKQPAALLAAIDRTRSLAWIGALTAGAVLFGGLAIVVIYSGRVLQKQEARLIEVERLAVVGEMASAVAHGLRNPLAAIRSCAELALDDDLPETSRGTIANITDQVDRLEGWIRSFLMRSRSDPGAISEGAQIDQVVQRCVENFQAQLEKRRIRVVLEKGAGSAIVASPAPELEQLLNSIISNAIEAMQEGGTLGIGWENRPGGQLELKVTDTGPGIPPEMIDRVFTPFETGKASGLGVGLALGRRIAERMGGTLDLQNRQGRGVEVTLTVPGLREA